MAHLFGAGFSYDAFLLSFRIPNLSRDLFAEGALSSAFVPEFTAALTKGGQQEAAMLANLVSTALILILGAICLIGMLFTPLLVGLLAPGFRTVPGKFELSVHLTRIMFPFPLLIALAAQATGILNSYGRFGFPALASTFFNVGAVFFGLTLGFWLGPFMRVTPVEGMAYGIVLGGALQLGWLIPGLRSFGFRFRPALDWSHPGLRRIFDLMLPAVLGSIAVQINVIVNTSFASRLVDPIRGHDGPVSWLGYAFRFVHLPLGLFAAAFASAMLPSVSRSAAINDFEEFRKTLSRSLGMVLLFTIPCSLALIILGRPIVGAVFQSGRFEAYDTRQTALALACYSAGLLAYASARVLNPAFYALSDARTPMYVTLFSIALNICLPLILLNILHFGFAALALTTSFAVTVECLFLFESLRRKLGGIEGRYLLDRLARISAASGVMGAALGGASYAIRSHLSADRWGYLSELAICLPLGLIVFAAASRALTIDEVNFALEVFVGPFRRRYSAAHARIRS